MQPKIPPHPTHDLRCSKCAFWHPDLIDNFSIDPISGQAMKASDALKNGVSAGRILTRASMCFLNPVWTLQSADMYCGNWVGKHEK